MPLSTRALGPLGFALACPNLSDVTSTPLLMVSLQRSSWCVLAFVIFLVGVSDVVQTGTKIGLFNADGFVSINFDSSSILLDFIQVWKLAPGAPRVDDDSYSDDSYSDDDREDDEDSEEDCVDYEHLTFGVADLLELPESQEVPEGLDWFVV